MAEETGGVGPLAAALPEYEIQGELGRGAMGVVLLARHRTLGRAVAIKELPSGFAADEMIKSRFLREARAVAGLSHPHIVAVYDFVDRGGRLALIMERLPGGTVWDRFVKTGFTPPQACAVVLSAAAGLDHAHRHGILHRDVKPENLMFSADGRLKVTDFGMAKVMGGERTLATADGVVVGTPAYMAPEQAEGITVGPPADVYACGTMLYEMLSGRLPYASAPTPLAMLVARIKDDPPMLLELTPSLPPAIVEVATTALARDVDARYRAVEDFAVALGRAAASTWGPDWLTATGVRVTGSSAIEEATRDSHNDLTRAPQRELGPTPSTETPLAGRDTIDPPNSAVDLGDRAVAAQPRPRQRIDLREVSLVDLVDITEVRRSSSALVPLLISVLLGVAAVAVVLLGSLVGRADSVESQEAAGVLIGAQPVSVSVPIEVDFSAPFELHGLGPGTSVEVDASLIGVPVGVIRGSLNNGSAVLDPEYLAWTSAGPVELVARVDGEPEPRATFMVAASNPWLTTAPTAAFVMALLFGLASLQSHLRGLRSGRFRLGSFIGLAFAGAFIASAALGLEMLRSAVEPSGAAMILVVVLGSSACVACGEGYRRRRRHRGLQQSAAWV